MGSDVYGREPCFVNATLGINVIPPRPDDNLVYTRNKNSEGLKGGEVLDLKGF